MNELEQSATLVPGANFIVGTFSSTGAEEVSALDVSDASQAVAPSDADTPRLTLTDIVTVANVATESAVARGTVSNVFGRGAENAEVFVHTIDVSGAGLGYASIPIAAGAHRKPAVESREQAATTPRLSPFRV